MPNPIAIDMNKAISEGKYANKIPYPDRPKKPVEPAIFGMRAGDMKATDLESLARQRKEYEQSLAAHDAAMKEYDKKREEHRKEEQRLEAQFKLDCEATCFGAGTGNLVQRKKDKVWSKAWEHGHADGFSNIWSWYEEFAEVANIF